MVLVNDKVGDHRFQLQRHGGGQRAGARMGLNADIIGVRHVADLTDLRQTAAVSDVRLDNLDGPIFKVGTILPARIDPLAGGQGSVV